MSPAEGPAASRLAKSHFDIFPATGFIRPFVTGLSQFRREFVIWNAQFTLTWIFQKRLPAVHGRVASGQFPRPAWLQAGFL
jgi:hypothetical protein